MKKLPSGKNTGEGAQKIVSVAELGALLQKSRKEQGLTQLDIAALAHTGNRFIVDLEKGKPTIQMQKALEVLDLLGLEVTIKKKGT